MSAPRSFEPAPIRTASPGWEAISPVEASVVFAEIYVGRVDFICDELFLFIERDVKNIVHPKGGEPLAEKYTSILKKLYIAACWFRDNTSWRNFRHSSEIGLHKLPDLISNFPFMPGLHNEQQILNCSGEFKTVLRSGFLKLEECVRAEHFHAMLKCIRAYLNGVPEAEAFFNSQSSTGENASEAFNRVCEIAVKVFNLNDHFITGIPGNSPIKKLLGSLRLPEKQAQESNDEYRKQVTQYLLGRINDVLIYVYGDYPVNPQQTHSAADFHAAFDEAGRMFTQAASGGQNA